MLRFGFATILSLGVGQILYFDPIASNVQEIDKDLLLSVDLFLNSTLKNRFLAHFLRIDLQE